MATIQPSEEQIRARAYQLFIERGKCKGRDIDDWLQAEYELTQLPVEAIARLEMQTPKPGKKPTSALVSLVQAAMLLGAGALPHLK